MSLVTMENRDSGPQKVRRFLRETFAFVGFGVACIVFVVVWIVGRFHPGVLVSGTSILLAEAALGVGILAVLLTALAILVSFLGEDYLQVLEKFDGGVRGALRPYKVVSLVGCLAVVTAFADGFAWPTLGPVWQAPALALPTAFGAWGLIGTVELVFLTAFHGENRALLLKGRIAAARKLQERRKEAS